MCILPTATLLRGRAATETGWEMGSPMLVNVAGKSRCVSIKVVGEEPWIYG